MERPLFSPTMKTVLTNVTLEAGEADLGELSSAALFNQVRVNKALLAGHVRQMLQTRPQISLGELLQARPLAQGLGELVTYLQIAGESSNSVVDEDTLETVEWQVPDPDASDVGSEHSENTASAATAQCHPSEPLDNPTADRPTITRRAKLPRVIFVRDAG